MSQMCTPIEERLPMPVKAESRIFYCSAAVKSGVYYVWAHIVRLCVYDSFKFFYARPRAGDDELL